ncbi:MAG: hypothetical protein Q4G58_13415 [bacterium]|nr:hypothetical protein [bacterium]
MSESLYRFISFDSFINLLVSQKTRYINPLLWKDSYESVVYRQMMDEQTNKEMIRYYYEKIKDPKKVVELYSKLWYEKTCSFAKCMTKTNENDSMWRIYRYNDKSVRIEITYDSLEECIKQYPEYMLVLQDIVYDEENCKPTKAWILDTMSSENQSIYNFCHKRGLFMHENEKRVLILDKSRSSEFECLVNTIAPCDPCETCEDEVITQIQSCIKSITSFQRIQEEIFLHIDPKRYIKSVLVNPFAEEHFIEIVKTMCINFGITGFQGKSNLYELKF